MKETYNQKITTKPELTVFDINPATNEPYMTVNHAERLAHTHLFTRCQRLLEKFSMDDLKQELLLKLCISKFDPSRAAAKTFAIMCFRSAASRVWQRDTQARDKWRENSDFTMFYDKETGKEYLATEVLCGDVEITAERIVIAKQELTITLTSPEYQEQEAKRIARNKESKERKLKAMSKN